MTTLTVEIPEEDAKLFKQFLKRLNGKIVSVKKEPNEATLQAIKELKEGKGIKFDNMQDFLKSI